VTQQTSTVPVEFSSTFCLEKGRGSGRGGGGNDLSRGFIQTLSEKEWARDWRERARLDTLFVGT
jgi:hypothetical protein